ncbi:MAG: mannosyltransferase family protein [Propionibacteriaceae bacterium]|nr:mannosyltransferase family protein [Propionibacteriaceae bacterium]
MARLRRHAADENLLIVQVWLISRLLFAVMAVALAVTGRRSLESVLSQWDVLHFLTIARDGYANPEQMAFFPGLPLLLRGFTELGLSPVLLGTLVSLVASLVAAFALKRLAGVWGAVAWILAPTAIFTAVPYTEALFCAFAFWAWERATRRHWGQAALLAALACTLRVSGLFLVGALVILALTQGRRAARATRGVPNPGLGARLAWLLLPTAVLAAYVAYLYALTGSWTAWFSAQEAGWNRGFHWPWEALANHWDVLWRPTPGHPEWVWLFRAEMVSWVVGVLVTVIALARRRVAEAAWVGVQVLAFSLSYWLMSVNRAVLLWFPLWRQLDELIDSRPDTRGWRTVGVLAAVVALVVQGVWAWLYLTGRWSS